MTYHRHKAGVVRAYREMGDPAQPSRAYREQAILKLGSIKIEFSNDSLRAMQQLLENDTLSEVRTFQGNRLIGTLIYRVISPTMVLRIFPVLRPSDGSVNVETHREVANPDRIYALVARCELQQPNKPEMDEILQELWDGTDAANWYDVEPD